MTDNGMFEQMCKSAAEELAGGGEGWRELPPNVIMLACFHLLTNHFTHKLQEIKKPLYFLGSCFCAAAIAVLLQTFFFSP